MKSLTTPISDQAAAVQSGWAELYDFYLKSSITTPFGVASVIRITACPGNLSFFTPAFDPEPTGTQATAATYLTWNVQRKAFKSSSKDANDKVSILASNVTGEWAQTLADVDWYDVPVVVRKISLTLAGTPTAQDCVTVFRGNVDSAKVTLEQLQFSCSNDFGAFNTSLPREDMHTNCRARWADDLCTAIRFKAENYKSKTAAAGCTTTRIVSTGLTEDTTVPLPLNPGNGCCLSFDGTNDYVQLPSYGTTIPTSECTIEWWQKVAENRQQTTYLLSPDDSTNRFSSAVPWSDGVVYFDFGNISTGGRLSYTPPSSILGKWQHFAMVVSQSGNYMRIFRNGVLEASKVGMDAFAQGSYTLFFAYFDGTSYYKGQLQEFRIWNYARTGTQIQSMMYSRATGAESGLVGCWHLDDGTGTTAADASPSGKPGTLTNSPTWLSAYGDDLITNLADGNISASSYQNSYEPKLVRMQDLATAHWRFSNNPNDPTPDAELYAPYLNFDFGSSQAVRKLVVVTGAQNDPDAYKARTFSMFYSTDNSTFYSAGSISALFNSTARTYTLTLSSVGSARYWRLGIKKSDGSPFLSDVAGTIKAYLNNSTSDLVDPSNNGTSGATVTASSQVTGHEGSKVKSGNNGTWRVNSFGLTSADFGTLDWGVNYQGYWQILDSQAGFTNHTLEPYIQFNFGGTVTPTVWRFRALADVERQDIPRLIAIYSSSSSDFSSGVQHETFFEMSPRPGQFFDCLIPNASSRQYWRICVRSNWAEAIDYVMFNKIQAFASSRNWWAAGRVKFDPSTATVALRGISASVLASYSGVVQTSPLPVAPTAGDTFTIERGCPRLFNACCERHNWENFAGFTTLPTETVVR